MKRILNLAAIAAMVITMTQFMACKDDDPPIAVISFEFDEMEVTESDGTFASMHPELTENGEGEGRIIKVKLLFDHALAEEAVIEFDIDGTALEKAKTNELNDFEILEEGDNLTVDGDEIIIAKGSTEASFNILVFEDIRFEYDEDALNADDAPFETVIITLESVVSGPIKMESDLVHTLKILEDDAVVFLQWNPNDFGDNPEDAEVDMDVLFWLDGAVAWLGATPGINFEAINVPAGIGEGNIGVSYTYYSGESDDLDFAGIIFNTAGTLNGDRFTYPNDDPLIFTGNYKKVNRNAWDTETGTQPKIAQTMIKEGVSYSSISDLTAFDEGSRTREFSFKFDKSMLKNVKPVSKFKGFRK